MQMHVSVAEIGKKHTMDAQQTGERDVNLAKFSTFLFGGILKDQRGEEVLLYMGYKIIGMCRWTGYGFEFWSGTG